MQLGFLRGKLTENTGETELAMSRVDQRLGEELTKRVAGNSKGSPCFERDTPLRMRKASPVWPAPVLLKRYLNPPARP